MSSILKRFTRPSANTYVFPDTDDLWTPEEDKLLENVEEGVEEGGELLPEDKKPSRPLHLIDPAAPVDYAKIQAEAIMTRARQDAEEIKAEALLEAKKELDELRELVREEGYRSGYAEGMAGAVTEAKLQREQFAMTQGREIKEFLELASREKDQMLVRTREDLKNLAQAIAEKVIRISLKSSGDILLRMIEAATEKRRRCEWMHIYIADCDMKHLTYTAPELAQVLHHLSDRVRIIPMADDESGTCIIEMPGEIIDASVSTQLNNIQKVLSGVESDRDGR